MTVVCSHFHLSRKLNRNQRQRQFSFFVSRSDKKTTCLAVRTNIMGQIPYKISDIQCLNVTHLIPTSILVFHQPALNVTHPIPTSILVFHQPALNVTHPIPASVLVFHQPALNVTHPIPTSILVFHQPALYSLLH